MYNFIQNCLRGASLPEDIDDYIDQWHEGDSHDSLHTFLGMKREEYATWVEKPNVLPFIIIAHKLQITLEEAMLQTSVATGNVH